jgi:preprotein translocase subunit SecE
MTTDVAERDEKPKRTGPLTFMREVRAEARKITWATRNEVMVSTLMVLVLSVIAGIVFFIVDFLLRGGVGFILNIGG